MDEVLQVYWKHGCVQTCNTDLHHMYIDMMKHEKQRLDMEFRVPGGVLPR